MKKLYFLLLSTISFYGVAQESKFNLNVRPRVNFSNVKFTNDATKYSEKIKADAAFGLGLEAEFIFKAGRNKWALTIEPVYNYAKGEATSKSAILGSDVTTVLDYKVLELPVGVRHYMFLNSDSKLFAEAQLLVNFAMNSKLKTTSGNNKNEIELKSKPNAAVGFGYNYKNKYGASVRYSFSRNLTGDYVLWSSNYNTFSFILSYNLL